MGDVTKRKTTSQQFERGDALTPADLSSYVL
ncbi:hypothetical protein BH24ACT26_BH24ACT26_00050 [soil metagenome]